MPHPKLRKTEHETGFFFCFLSPFHVQAFGIKQAARRPGTVSTCWTVKLSDNYLSCTTSLQLRTTMIPDTVAIVAWTVDTSLKPRERKWVTPNVTPAGPRSRSGPSVVAPAELLAPDAHSVHTPNASSRRGAALSPARAAWDGTGWLCQALSPGDTAGGCFQGLVPSTPVDQR